MMISTRDIATLLKETAALLELKGEKAFRVRAYSNAARSVDRSGIDAEDILPLAKQGKIPGVGKGIAGDIEAILKSGSLPLRDELIQFFPDGLLELLAISGLGAKKLKILYDELSIQNLDTLETACKNNQLRTLKGFGEKTEENILQAVHALRSYKGKARRDTALKIFQEISDLVRTSFPNAEILQSGELRRGNEIICNIEIVLSGCTSDKIQDIFDSHPSSSKFKKISDSQLSFLFSTDVPVTLHLCSSSDEVPRTLLETTGSVEHLQLLGDLDKLDWSSIESEEEAYRSLGLASIPAELREGGEEVGQAETLVKEGFSELIADSHIKGVLHAHSTYSDGKHKLKELATAVRDMGYSYLGISDHSQAAFYASGLKPDKVKRQHEEIDKLNEELFPFKIFKGIESDILKDGSLDYEENILQSFDFIVASIHARFGMNKKQMTERLLKAIKNPFTTWIGHLSGRLLLKRESFEFDIETILDACQEHGVALEINANPRRLDIDWRYLSEVTRRGIPLLICPDAHSIQGVSDMQYGVSVARKGAITPSQVLNTMGSNEFANYLNTRKHT